ncbi:hypothetical protein NL676_033121 [Syzygium grande]|nr:hypothetical protein NL676_033121 [Syzygium grande]
MTNGIIKSPVLRVLTSANKAESFALPVEEKQKYSRASNEAEGYGDDLVVNENRVKDYCCRLFLKVLPEDQRRMNLWPENPTDLGYVQSETLRQYALKIRSAMNDLSKVMARSLELEENSFLDQYGDRPVLEVRFNFYPPCSRAEVFGAKPHLDRSAITVLLQDKEVEGLQVLKDGMWHTVSVIPHALFVKSGWSDAVMHSASV